MKKIIKISAITVCIIIGLLILIPTGALIYLNTPHATRLIQNIINNKIPGSLTWQKHHIKLLQGELDFRGLALKGPSGEKLASIGRLYCNISTPQLFKKEIKIEAFYLEKPRVAMQIDTTGALNVTRAFMSDTLKEEPVKEPEKQKEEGEPLNFHLDSLWLGKAAISYATSKGEFRIASKGIEINAKGDLAQKTAMLDLKIQDAEVTLDRSSINLSDLVLFASLQDGKIEPIVFKVSSPGSQISLQSSIENIYEKPLASLDLSVKCALEEISSLLKISPGLSGKTELQFTAEGSPTNPDAELRLDYSGGSLAGAEVDKTTLVLKVNDRYAEIDTLNITAASGTIALQGEADMRTVFADGYFDSSATFDNLSYKADLTINQVELSQIYWLAEIISGDVTSHIAAEGSGILPEKMAGSTQISLEVKNLFTKSMPSQLDVQFKTDGSMQKGVATLNQFELHSDFAGISGKGTYDLKRHFVDGSLTIDTTDLAAIMPLFDVDSLRGSVLCKADVSGFVKKNLKANCSFRGYDLAYLPYPLGDLELAASLDSLGYVTLSRLSLNNKQSSLNIKGSAALFATGTMNMRKEPAFDVTIENSRFFLQDFMDSLFGEVLIGAHVQGTPSALYGNVSITGDSLDLGAQKMHGVSLHAELDSQRVHIKPMQIAVTPGEVITASGWLGLNNAYSLSLSTPGISLKSFDKVNELETIDGTLVFDFTAEGTFDNPGASGSITINEVTVQENTLDDINLNISLKDQLARLSGNLGFGIGGSYHLKEKDFEVITTFKETDLSPYFSIAEQQDFYGNISGTVTVSGNTDSLNLERIKLKTDISDISIYHKKLEALSSEGINLSIEKKHIDIKPIHIALLKKGKIDISGGGDLDGQVDFRLDATIPANLASLFSADLTDADGAVIIHGALSGNIKDPDVKTDIDFNDISLTVPELLQRLHSVNGHVSVTPQKVTIDSIGGMLDNGLFDCAGTVDLDSMKLSNFSIALNANTIPINMPEMLDMLFNAQMSLHGSMDSSVIEGSIEMLEGIYYRDLSIISGIGQKKREIKPEKEKVEDSFLNNLNFDVIIKARDNFVVDNNIAQLQIDPDLRLVGTLNRPVINGQAKVVPGDGTITYLRNTFIVEKGVIDFTNPYKIEPVIDIVAVTQKREWKIKLTVSGSTEDITFTVSSEPDLEHEDIISLLMVGRTTYELSRGELMEGGGSTEELVNLLIEASNIGKNIREATGLDVFSVEARSGSQKLTVGKALNKRLMTTLAVESKKGELTQKAIVEYKIMENIILQTYNDDNGDYGGEIHLKFDFL